MTIKTLQSLVLLSFPSVQIVYNSMMYINTSDFHYYVRLSNTVFDKKCV